MDKLFKKCIEKHDKIDHNMVWSLIYYVEQDLIKDLSMDELFDLRFWDIALSNYASDTNIQIILIKYGDKCPSLLKQYMKTNVKDYGLNDEQKEIYNNILNNLSIV